MIADASIIVLFGIAFSLIILNLYLTIRLIQTLQKMAPQNEQAEPVELGSQMLPLEAEHLEHGKPFNYANIQHEAKVFLFLSSVCPKCKSKLTEVEQLVARSQNLGVSLWLLSDENPKKIRQFLNGTSLYPRLLGVSQDVLKQYNPVLAYPYYLFLDQQDILQAEGIIGDENWMLFCEQVLQDAA